MILLVRQGVPVSLAKWTLPRPSRPPRPPRPPSRSRRSLSRRRPAPSSESLRRYGEGAAGSRGNAVPSVRNPLDSLISSPVLPLALSSLSALHPSQGPVRLKSGCFL